MLNKIANFLQLTGLMLDFIGFLILFFNSKKRLRKIDPKSVILRSGGLFGGGRSADNYLKDTIENLAKNINGILADLVDQLNKNSRYTKMSWGLVALGFALQFIGIFIQLFPIVFSVVSTSNGKP